MNPLKLTDAPNVVLIDARATSDPSKSLRLAPVGPAANWSAVRVQSEVPVVSIFFGIVIRMFFREHGIGHFHAEYQGQTATFTFDGKLLAGRIRSRTALRLIEEWATRHHAELAANWRRVQAGEPLESIEPLD